MKKVICINDKNLPEGASVIEGKEYTVEKEFINMFGQRAYIIAGITNEGHTPRGLHWYGYSAERFTAHDSDKIEVQVQAFVLN